MDAKTAAEIRRDVVPADTEPRVHSSAWHFPSANSLPTAVALSASAGYLDAFTFVGHGHVFASAMTGNMVLLGLNIATLGPASLTYAYPILAYVCGVITAHILLRESIRRRLFARPHVLTLLFEIAVLLSVAFGPFRLADQVLVSIITISTSMQNTSFRNIGRRTYNSVIMTGNLQNFANLLAGGTAPYTPAKLAEACDLGAVILSFAAGAAAGAVMTPRLGLHAVAVPAALLAIGAVVLILSRDEPR